MTIEEDIQAWMRRILALAPGLAEGTLQRWPTIKAVRSWPDGDIDCARIADYAGVAYADRNRKIWDQLSDLVLHCGMHEAPADLFPLSFTPVHQTTVLMARNRWDLAGIVADVALSRKPGRNVDPNAADMIISRAVLFAVQGRQTEAQSTLGKLTALLERRRISRNQADYYATMIPLVAAFNRGSWDEFNTECSRSTDERAANVRRKIERSKRSEYLELDGFDYLNFPLATLLFSAQRRGALINETSDFANIRWMRGDA